MAEYAPEKSDDWIIAHASPAVNRAVEQLAKMAGLDKGTAGRLLLDPNFAEQITQGTKKRLSSYLFAIWDKLFEKAMDGNVTAIKEFMKRFDVEYQEILKSADGPAVAEEDLPTFDGFQRMMIRRFGEDNWRAAQELARRTGREGGVFGEHALPGGEREGSELEPADTIADEMEIEELEDLFGAGP